MIEQSKYTAACYCRLSRDDEQDGTSISIETQKKVLEDYCKANGYTVYDFYCDDGFTGTNFDRPSFKRMMSDVQNGIVNMVVVKDLSKIRAKRILRWASTLRTYFLKGNSVRGNR